MTYSIVRNKIRTKIAFKLKLATAHGQNEIVLHNEPQTKVQTRTGIAIAITANNGM